MTIIWMTALASVMIAAAAYAQLNIPRYTADAKRVVMTRSILIAVGIAVGYVCAASYLDSWLHGLVAFLIGFGAVHGPAAVILWIKRKRGAGKS